MSRSRSIVGVVLTLAVPTAAIADVAVEAPLAPAWTCGTLDVDPTDGTHNLALWPDGFVYYEFDPAVASIDRTAFVSSLGDLEAVCGLRFFERTDEPDYIFITNSTVPGVSFSSSIGMAGGMQTIGMSIWDNPSVVWHEMMHAVGFFHEQSRPDRDEYVEIVWGNIDSAFAGNFSLVASSIPNGPYDFASIMHYSCCSFSVNGGRTIDVRPPHQTRWQFRLSTIPELSNGDIWTLTDLYGGTPPPRSVVLTAPARDVFVDPGSTPTFDWEDAAGAEAYRLLVDDDFDFSSPIIDMTLLDSAYTHDAAFAEGTVHYWKVVAENAVGEAAPLYDPFFRFYTGDVPGPTLHVDDDAPAGGDGSDWSSPLKDLRTALTIAAFNDADVEVIKVAGGVYTPDAGTGDSEAAFELVSQVALRGGYAGSGAADPDARDIAAFPTVLSGDLAGDDGPDFANNDENAWTVVRGQYLSAGTELDGVTIRGGNADSGPVVDGAIASALFAIDSKATMRNCTITECDAVVGTVFAYGRTMTVESCAFIGNRADVAGGAIFNEYGSDMFVRDCVFEGNSAQFGGALFVQRGQPEYDRCWFSGNSAQFSGAAHADFEGELTLVSCGFWNNEATAGPGGAVGDTNGGLLELINVTMAGNTASGGGGAGAFQNPASTVENGILWDNAPDEVLGTPVIRYSTVEKGWAGEGNLDSDPELTSLGDGNLRPLPTSPVIDAGDDDAVPSFATTDLDGNERIAGPAVDMGAYESPATVPGDVDGDGVVDFTDLLSVLAAWGACPPGGEPCPADLDGDGAVGFSDLLLVLANWS
ncbi:MAG: hypothetical protein HKO59_11210 [Phycisphaerales bacterium]|nr:right-handed parallel beta-helix repeat-containing protein [Phycisphaerae bacterium]NNM26530.1 hypothetical protein [Phycisphaerales bacterium]